MFPDRLDAAESFRTQALLLRSLMAIEGFVGCAVADLRSGQLIVGESHERGLNLPHTGRILADALRSQLDAARALGCIEPVEEVVMCAGADQYVMRPLAAPTHQFIFAKLDHSRANLTLARMKLAEAQHALA
jgi:hypothetical protein